MPPPSFKIDCAPASGVRIIPEVDFSTCPGMDQPVLWRYSADGAGAELFLENLYGAIDKQIRNTLYSNQYRQHPWRRVPSRRQPSECKAPGTQPGPLNFGFMDWIGRGLKKSLKKFLLAIDKQILNCYSKNNTDSIPGGESPPAANPLSAWPRIPSRGLNHFGGTGYVACRASAISFSGTAPSLMTFQ